MVGPLGTQSDEFQGALYATYLVPFPPDVGHHKNGYNLSAVIIVPVESGSSSDLGVEYDGHTSSWIPLPNITIVPPPMPRPRRPSSYHPPPVAPMRPYRITFPLLVLITHPIFFQAGERCFKFLLNPPNAYPCCGSQSGYFDLDLDSHRTMPTMGEDGHRRGEEVGGGRSDGDSFGRAR